MWVLQRAFMTEEGAAPPESRAAVARAVRLGSMPTAIRAKRGGTGRRWVAASTASRDHKGFVWLGGNADTDSAIFKYTKDGKLGWRSARSGRPRAATTPHAGQPADIQVDPATNEVFVADGYGNRRVIVFDADTGAYKRHWGAYGHKPSDDKTPKYDPAAPVSQQFGNPVHCAKVSKDGFVYVCDRTNNRIQVFKKDGTYVTEWFFDKNTLGAGAVWDLTLWPDANQTYLLNIDGENNQLRVLKRSDGSIVGGFGRSGRYAGQFHWVHNITVDSKGNVYTGEVDTANRVQKFKPTSPP
jgi:DNA-binding beta-propeller fold protein YncE